jgi:hypothetical protein
MNLATGRSGGSGRGFSVAEPLSPPAAVSNISHNTIHLHCSVSMLSLLEYMYRKQVELNVEAEFVLFAVIINSPHRCH